MKPRVVLADIAERLGIHKSTVSLALRDSPKISLKTRKLVQETAESMGYTPDPQLLSLVSYRQARNTPKISAAIAIITDVQDPLFAEQHLYMKTTVDAIRTRAQRLGFSTETFRIDEDSRQGEKLDRILKARGIRGILVNHLYSFNSNLDLDWDHYAVVKINSLPTWLKADTVVGNYLAGIDIIFEQLKKMGHKRIGIALEKGDEVHLNNICLSRFLTRQLECPEKDRIAPLMFEAAPREVIIKKVDDWLKANQPDVFMAHWSIAECAERFTQHTGNPCRFISLEVESDTIAHGGIRNKNHKMGEKAMDLLCNRMKDFRYGLPEAPTTVLVEPEWIEPGQNFQ